MSDKDIVVEARELLAEATSRPWRAVAYIGAEPRHISAGEFTEQSTIATPDNPNGLVAFADLPANARLIARAPELLRALADEVARQRTALTKLRDSTSDMWACSFAGDILKAVPIDEALDHAKKYDKD